MSRARHRAVVEPEEAGKTLAAIVRSMVPEISWNRARELCRSGRVRVDGRLSFEDARRLEADMLVEVEPAGPRMTATPLEHDRIVHVDHEIVVVRKPADLLSVPYDARDHDTLLERTRLAIRHKGELGVVQRLDKDTTGLMVFARTRVSRKHLQRQFRAHSIVRGYLALAHGEVASARHESDIVPDRGDGKRGSWRGSGRPPPSAKRATTIVDPIERLGTSTLVECRLETGRQHQIRIHLAEAGHPLVGERVYAQARDTTPIEAPRPMLHAATLGFRHPAHDRMVRFDDPLPDDFAALLQRLRRGAQP